MGVFLCCRIQSMQRTEMEGHPLLESLTEHRGTMRGVRSHPGGGGQQLKSQQCCEMVRVRLKAHEAIYHAPHSRPAALR